MGASEGVVDGVAVGTSVGPVGAAVGDDEGAVIVMPLDSQAQSDGPNISQL